MYLNVLQKMHTTKIFQISYYLSNIKHKYLLFVVLDYFLTKYDIVLITNKKKLFLFLISIINIFIV